MFLFPKSIRPTNLRITIISNETLPIDKRSVNRQKCRRITFVYQSIAAVCMYDQYECRSSQLPKQCTTLCLITTSCKLHCTSTVLLEFFFFLRSLAVVTPVRIQRLPISSANKHATIMMIMNVYLSIVSQIVTTDESQFRLQFVVHRPSLWFSFLVPHNTHSANIPIDILHYINRLWRSSRSNKYTEKKAKHKN